MSEEQPKGRRIDPVDELAGLLIVMRRQSSTAAVALSRVEHNRFNLLMVHAVAAILIGLLFMASAPTLVGPIWSTLDNIPGFPYTFAGVLVAGGLILLPGSIARIARLEYIGLGLIYVWYLVLAIGFFIPTAVWGWDAIVALYTGSSHNAPRPSLYAWVVYLHLALIMRVHMWTLRNIRKNQAIAVNQVRRQQERDAESIEQVRKWTEKPPLGERE